MTLVAHRLTDTAVPHRTTVRSRSARPAAVAYVLAWVAGLSVSASSTEVRASGSAVLAAVHGHAGDAAVQYVLTEGVTSVLLLPAVLPLWRSCRGRLARSVSGAAALAAVAVSFVECALGLALSTGSPTASAAGSLNDAINRLDGVKMLLLAVAVAAIGLTQHRTGRRRLEALAGVTAAALAVSGTGYVLLDDGPAAAAWASLPLLIGCVVVAAFTRGDAARTRG